MNRVAILSTVGLLLVGLPSSICSLRGEPQAVGVLSGIVRLQGGGPASGAWVRVQATPNLTYTAVDGTFTLAGLAIGTTVTVTAWYPLHKIGWTTGSPPASNLEITLRPYDTRDNPDYEWNTSYADPANPTLGCGHCMYPAFSEWRVTAHAGSATNPRFLSIYSGTNLSRTHTVAPGYKLDFPGTAGNCASCHAPAAAANAPLSTDMETVSGIAREGVFCEFCHKIGDVYLDPATNRPNDDAPGVMSLRLYRPYFGDQIFFGSLDDVTRRVSYLPLEKKSQFCAPCHQFSFSGTPIYQSYREWQESPYPALGIECQTCHMPPGTSTTFVLPEQGGLNRDPSRLASHKDLGLKDLEFMQSTVRMEISLQQTSAGVDVRVSLKNVGAGHHVPTDSPLRNLILLVAATDQQGRALALRSGPVVPAWGGDHAGKPGQGYAKILRDPVTGESPVASYWKPTVIVSDNRIAALATESTQYLFELPESGAARASATLIFRRAFQPLETAKGWPSSDIVMAQASTGNLVPAHLYLPAIGKDAAPNSLKPRR